MSELLPCPFPLCQGEAVYENPPVGFESAVIYCKKCGAELSGNGDIKLVWNTRHTDQSLTTIPTELLKRMVDTIEKAGVDLLETERQQTLTSYKEWEKIIQNN